MKLNNHFSQAKNYSSVNVTKKRTRAQFRASLLETVRSEPVLKQRANTTKKQKQKGKVVIENTSNSKKNKMQRQSEIVDYFKLKKCKKIQCQHTDKDQDLIICDLCKDAYHWFCVDQLQSKPKDDFEFWCSTCRDQYVVYKKLKLDESAKKKQKLKCPKCLLQVDTENDNKQCLRCESYFHLTCFKHQNDEMFCNNCYDLFIRTADDLLIKPQSKKKVQILKNLEKLSQTPQITKYFQHQKHQYDGLGTLSYEIQPEQLFSSQQVRGQQNSQFVKKNKRKSVSLSMKKKHVFKLPKLIEDPILELEVKESFKKALFAKKMKYATKLIYDNPNIPESLNQSLFEPTVQKLNIDNKSIVYQLRQREEQGILPPLKITYDPISGFGVEAAVNLPDLCLLCEYVGEVRNGRDVIFNKNDSIMNLLESGDADTSLCVVPQKFTNICRFFNGINNSKKSSKSVRTQNLRSMRCQFDDKIAVLLYTRRPVKKGEPLLYDYNEAGNQYDTEDFV